MIQKPTLNFSNLNDSHALRNNFDSGNEVKQILPRKSTRWEKNYEQEKKRTNIARSSVSTKERKTGGNNVPSRAPAVHTHTLGSPSDLLMFLHN